MKGLRDTKGTRNTCIFRRENRLSYLDNRGSRFLWNVGTLSARQHGITSKNTYFQGHRSETLDPPPPTYTQFHGSCLRLPARILFILNFISIQRHAVTNKQTNRVHSLARAVRVYPTPTASSDKAECRLTEGRICEKVQTKVLCTVPVTQNFDFELRLKRVIWEITCLAAHPDGRAISGLRVRPLGLGVRIPKGACMSVACECCLLSGRGLYDGSIPQA